MRAWISSAATAAVLLCFAAGCDSDSMVSRDFGARCERHADCDERCLLDLDTNRYPDGFCSTSCDSDRDCADGAVCAELEGGVCLFACDDPGSCSFLGVGWDCVPHIEHASDRTSRAPEQPLEVHVCLGP